MIASARRERRANAHSAVQDPNWHWIEIIEEPKTMTAVAYVPPNVLPPLLQKFAGLLKRKWFRELVLAPPTVTRRRFSNKTEDYGVFQPSLIQRIGQLSIYVQHIARSRAGTKLLAGLRIAEPARRSRIPSNRDGGSAAAT